MKTTTRRLAGALLAVATLAGLTACATRAPSDYVVLYYSAGSGEDRKFVECIEPGTNGSYPVDDEIFVLPTSLRTWNIRPDGGDTNVPINSGSKPGQPIGADGKPTGPTQAGPEVAIWATADFYINTDCTGGADSPVVQFWDRTGRRYGISQNATNMDPIESGFRLDAFAGMLKNTLVPAEEAAIRQGTRNYSADDLDANVNDVWTALSRQLGPDFNRSLREKVGGDYFCGPEYQRGREVEWSEYVPTGTDANGVATFREERQRGKCPPVRITITDVAFSNAEIAKARAGAYAADQDAKAKVKAAQAELDAANILGQAASNEAYLKFKQVEAQAKAAEACAKNPSCTVIIDGTGGAGVNVGGR